MDTVESSSLGASEKKMHPHGAEHHVRLTVAARSAWCSAPVSTAYRMSHGGLTLALLLAFAPLLALVR